MSRTRALLLLGGIAMLGCGMSTSVPRLMRLEAFEGFKMLKPGATATECEPAAFWSSSATVGRDLGSRAVERLLALDDEADAVVNARFEWTFWSIGVFGRRCVTLTGDVVRSVRTVRLPMVGHDGDHAGHHGQ